MAGDEADTKGADGVHGELEVVLWRPTVARPILVVEPDAINVTGMLRVGRRPRPLGLAVVARLQLFNKSANTGLIPFEGIKIVVRVVRRNPTLSAVISPSVMHL